MTRQSRLESAIASIREACGWIGRGGNGNMKPMWLREDMMPPGNFLLGGVSLECGCVLAVQNAGAHIYEFCGDHRPAVVDDLETRWRKYHPPPPIFDPDKAVDVVH